MTVESRPEAARVHRATSGTLSFALSALLVVFLLGDVVVRTGWGQMLLLAPWLLLGLWVVYEVAFVSMVRIDADGALVQNMLRRTSFGWRRVRDIDLRWQLVFSLDDGTELTSYGGPAKARPPRRTSDGAASAPTAVRTLTDIRDRWEAAPASADAAIARTWDIPALIALVVIVLWAAASVVITAS
ncbi:PH domain-containing protein [Microbacterium sp. ZW T5_45]|uniref:PH domain-containing protein n=1 Tax=Microbacterium sp. ZW T5_45 TaxID=3378080 RepID=UPI003851BF2B